MKWNELKVGMKVVPMRHLGGLLYPETARTINKDGYLRVKSFTFRLDNEPVVCLDDNNYYYPDDLEEHKSAKSFEPETVTLVLDTPEKMALLVSFFNDEDIIQGLDRQQGGKVYSESALSDAFDELLPYEKWVELSRKLEEAT